MNAPTGMQFTQRFQCISTVCICYSQAIAFVASLCLGITSAQTPQPLQHAWELSPNFGDIWAMTEPVKSYAVNVESLGSLDTEQRLVTAQLICLNHDKDGFKGAARAIELLMARLSSHTESVLVERVMVSAVCLLDDGTQATALWEVANEDEVMRTTVERALAKWKKSTAIEIWRGRVRSPASNANDLALALEGLATVGTVEDRPSLISCMRSRSISESNLVLASMALGATNASGLNALAEELLGSALPDRYTLVAHLLRNHSDEKSLAKLLLVLNSGPNTARRIAAEGVASHFPRTAVELAPSWTTDADNNLRRLSLLILKGIKAPESIKLQAALLGDTDVHVRNLAREQLLELAQGDMRAVVDECISEQLNSDNWRGIEQSVILSTQLRDQSRCDSFVKLLDHPQPEVYMHAGWGLMELADKPEILEQIQRYCEPITDQLEKGSRRGEKSETIRLSFLLEALGKNRISAASPTLKRYIPKQDFRMGNLSRASAIWALGQIEKETDDPALRGQLRERIQDLASMTPENYLVGYACMLALGEFGYKDSKETIKKTGARRPNPLGYAVEWAVEKIDQAGR
ncbi:MAG: hypothetical protein FJ308_12220 [Planctomycetes bacterium]|nr:hypothetical protein [Planctomycetota bacterium]